jgi:hypothetical protein
MSPFFWLNRTNPPSLSTCRSSNCSRVEPTLGTSCLFFMPFANKRRSPAQPKAAFRLARCGDRLHGTWMRRLVVSLLGLSLTLACGSRQTPAGYAGDTARAFVRDHRAALQGEIELGGSGPQMHELSILADCQDVPELGRALHRKREVLFSPAGSAALPSDAEVAERVVTLLGESPELRCLGLELGRQREFSAGRRHVGPTRSDVALHGAP